MTDSQQLLREYVESSSDTAFRELVGRYIDLVYSVALRRTDHDTRIAEDIAQTVFTDLSKKAGTLPANVMLGGWLHQHTCFVAANMLRNEKRRTAREQQALEMNMLHDDPDESWKQLAPILDDAIEELAPAERDAVVLRFFEQRDFRSVGAALGVSDDTAQKRVSRALEKLRELLVQRGVTMGVVALGTALADRSIQAAPGELGASIANVVEHSSHVGGVASKGGSFARLMVLTSVVALLLVTVLHPEVSGRLWSLFQSREGDVAADVQSQTDGTIAALPGADSAAIASTNSIVSTEIAGTPQPNAVTNVLRLTIVADDSGRPVPNVVLATRCVTPENFKIPKFVANRLGICDVPLLENISELQIITQIEGFADTRLRWNVDRGQSIPASYTVRLVRPVRISGQVLDPDGKPVAGAKVAFGHQDYAALSTNPIEDHRFGWIDVKTDSEGRWQMNRIAPEMIRHISGRASHPDYIRTQSGSLEGNAGLEKSLRDGTHIFRLGKAFSIRGSVLDPEGATVPNAKVLLGERSMVGSQFSRTAADGTFFFKGVEPGKTVLTAEIKGFAATTIPVEITEDLQEFTLTLQPGKTLRMRILGPDGEPVSRAEVWLETMSHNLELKDKNVPPTQASFGELTDELGQITWENAPDRELQFYIHHHDYMSQRDVQIHPQEEEHIITLQRALTVSGTVRDAENGQDIPRFRIICGWPEQNSPRWSPYDRDWLNFEKGQFKHTFRDPLIFGRENPGYILKVEAEGYESFVSRTIKPNERNVELEVLLKSAITPIITVLLPDGQRAAVADVGLVSPNSQLEMKSGAFDREHIRNPAALLQTDTLGQFRLPADPAISKVIIAHPLGFADLIPAELLNNRVVHLQEWGRLEGTYHRESKPVKDGEFILEFTFAESDAIKYSFNKKVRTDANGRFVFPQILPGKQRLVLLRKTMVTTGNTRHMAFGHEPLKEVEIESGKTATVEIGSSGYIVKARFQFPPGTDLSGIRVISSLHTPFPAPPVEIREDEAAVEQWRQTPQIAGQLAKIKRYSFATQSDGGWAADNVPPGEYIAEIHCYRNPKIQNGVNSWFSGDIKVIVPEEPTSGTVDLGEIILQAASHSQRR